MEKTETGRLSAIRENRNRIPEDSAFIRCQYIDNLLYSDLLESVFRLSSPNGMKNRILRDAVFGEGSCVQNR